jgi:hypothetical protein
MMVETDNELVFSPENLILDSGRCYEKKSR